MSIKVPIVLDIDLPSCPFCNEPIELQDCTGQDYGWRGYRILCRSCNLIMYSRAPLGTELIVSNGVLQRNMDGPSYPQALTELLDRWCSIAEVSEHEQAGT